jgi:transposase-like protein
MSKKPKYSTEFKKSTLEKVSAIRGKKTLQEIAQLFDIDLKTLQRWLYEHDKAPNADENPFQEAASVSNKNPALLEKMNFIIGYYKLSEEKKGEYLRGHGLYSVTVEQWEKSLEQGVKAILEENKHQSLTITSMKGERADLKLENGSLKRNLDKKDRALAEISALLILKKKLHLIWQAPEEGAPA